MATESFELKFYQWLLKVTEKLTFIHLKVQDGKDITEEDYQLMEALHPVWFDGVFPIYATRLSQTEEIPVQQGLFGSIDTTKDDKTSNGKVVDNGKPKPKKEEK